MFVAFAMWLRHSGRVRWANRVLFGCGVVFCLASTRVVPEALIYRLESQYDVLHHSKISSIGDSLIYIHVLGAGYSAGNQLPANARLGPNTLGRLAEGMRLGGIISGGVLVSSGAAHLREESQADVIRWAAVELGFDSTRTLTLNTPNTTAEEAEALRDKLGTEIALVVVTDALHMPRAIRIFENRGFKPIPAPTNFVIKNGPASNWIRWFPSVQSILLTDKLLHELFGFTKEILVNRR